MQKKIIIMQNYNIVKEKMFEKNQNIKKQIKCSRKADYKFQFFFKIHLLTKNFQGGIILI